MLCLLNTADSRSAVGMSKWRVCTVISMEQLLYHQGPIEEVTGTRG